MKSDDWIVYAAAISLVWFDLHQPASYVLYYFTGVPW